MRVIKNKYKIGLCLILFLIPRFVLAQENGIHFESGLSWEAIQEKAKAENKYIFVDCYATWCGPCKFMSREIFTQKEVGDYMNSHFVSVAIQVDQTPNDNAEVKKWYGKAKKIVEAYSITELPTYLFFSPDGHAVHRVVGSTGKESKDFMAKAEESLDSNKQYYTLIESYKKHENDSVYLRNSLIKALTAADITNAENICNFYLASIKYPYTVDNLRLIEKSTKSSSDKGFKLFLNNASRIDSVFKNNGRAEVTVCNIISEEDIDPLFQGNLTLKWGKIAENIQNKYPELTETIVKVLFEKYFQYDVLKKEIRVPLYKDNAPLPDWLKISTHIKEYYPGWNPSRLIAKEKLRYYDAKKLWPEYEKLIIPYVTKYGDQLGSSELNDLAWGIFMHSKSQKELLEGLQLSKRSITDSLESTDYEKFDTYANLLYKIGDKENAIMWEKRALENSLKFTSIDKRTQNSYRITLQKMEKGQDTRVGRNSNDEYE